MVKLIKDDFLKSYGGLIQYSCYLKEAFKGQEALGVIPFIGNSFELLEKLFLIEEQLKSLEKDKSESLNVDTYRVVLNIRGSDYLINEFFPLSTFSPYVELFFQKTGEMQSSQESEILKALQLALAEQGFKKSVLRMRKNDREKQALLSRYIYSLFAYLPSLLVIDIDLSYVEEWNYNQPLNADIDSIDDTAQTEENIRTQRIERVQNERNELITQLKKKYKKDLVGYIWKLDYSTEKNFYYNMMLFLDGQKYQNDVEIAEGIGSLWKSITEAKGIYFNKNLHKYDGTGLIQHSELQKRKSLQKRALYLIKTDYFIKMKLKAQNGQKLHTFDRGQIPKRIQSKIS